MNNKNYRTILIYLWAVSSLVLLLSCNSKSDFENIGGPNNSLGSPNTSQSVSNKITQFVFKENYPLSANFFQNMKAAHLNNDSSLDLILTESTKKKISILLNDGTGNFSLSQSLNTSNKVYSRILTEDLNNDGHLDLCVASYGGVLNIWLNDGSNGFPLRIDVPTTTGGKAVNFITSGDINGDGLIDIAVSNTINSNSGSIAVLINNGSSSLSFTQTEIAIGLAPYGAVLSDLNNDGLDDLATTGRNNSQVHIFNNISGVLTHHSSFVASVDPSDSKLTDIISADFNKDGVMDLAWGSECTLGKFGCHKDNYDQHVYVTHSDLSLSLSPIQEIKTKAYGDVRMLQAYDVNIDGHLDLISIDDINSSPFAAQGEYSSLSIFINDKADSFLSVQNKMLAEERDGSGAVTAPGSSYSNSFAFGDFNNDGLTDFFADAKLNGASLSSGVRLYIGKK